MSNRHALRYISTSYSFVASCEGNAREIREALEWFIPPLLRLIMGPDVGTTHIQMFYIGQVTQQGRLCSVTEEFIGIAAVRVKVFKRRLVIVILPPASRNLPEKSSRESLEQIRSFNGQGGFWCGEFVWAGWVFSLILYVDIILEVAHLRRDIWCLFSRWWRWWWWLAIWSVCRGVAACPLMLSENKYHRNH